MINITNFDPNLLKIDKKLYTNIDINYIRCITMKDSGYVKIKSINSLYLIISEVDGHFEEEIGNKYLILESPNKNKELLEKYTQPWDGIKNEIVTINGGKPGLYGKDFMKIKFNFDDNLPLNKTLKFHNIIIIIRSVFEKYGRFYLQIYLDECLYEL